MSIPKVSVLMTIYNNEDYIIEAIESVLALDYESLEFILVDDGSADCSIELLEPYFKQDSRIQLYRHEQNLGVARATKTGLHHCTGEYILFAAADDISYPHRAKVCVERFQEMPQVGLLVSRATVINDQSKLTGESYGPPPHVNSSNIVLHQLKRNYCLGAALALRNDQRLLRQDHILELADDYQLSLEYILHGYQIGVIDGELVQYRIHSNNVSNNHRELNNRVVTAIQSYNVNLLMKTLRDFGHSEGDILVAGAIFEMFRGNTDEGERLMEQSIGKKLLEPGAEFEQLFYLAFADYRKEEYARGYERLLKAANLNPEDPACLNNLAVFSKQLGFPEEIVHRYLKKSIECFPGYLDAQYNIQHLHKGSLKYTARILEPSKVRREKYKLQ